MNPWTTVQSQARAEYDLDFVNIFVSLLQLMGDRK